VTFVAIALPVLAASVLALLWSEVRRFKAGRHLISARRLGLRLVAGGLMIALLAAVFVGLFALHLDAVGSRPHFFMAYWSGCLLIALALILVMLADMREVEARYTQRQREIRRDLASFLAGRVGPRQAEEQLGPADESEQ